MCSLSIRSSSASAEAVQLRGVEQRHQAGDPLAGVQAGLGGDHQRFQVDRGVAADDALRERRRAARVQVADRVALVDEHVRRVCRVVVVQLAERAPVAIG
jgi:hypothetical protein